MNKFTYALALGAGLVLSLAGPSAHASPIQDPVKIQDLKPTPLSADQFNSFFTPISGVNNVNDSTNQPIGVNSTAMYFNATPYVQSLAGSPSAVYIVNGAIGGMNAPTPITNVGGVPTGPTPSHVFWQPGTKTGSLTFQYLDAASNSGPLMAGSSSGTLVVLSTQAPSSSQLYVSLQSPDPQNGYPQVYSPQTGEIAQVPVPEPATLIGWTGVIGALALVHRVRRNRKPA